MASASRNWIGTANEQIGTDADLEYGNLIALGEFVLGYENEYGFYTKRPLLDAAEIQRAPCPRRTANPSGAISDAMAHIACSGNWTRT